MSEKQMNARQGICIVPYNIWTNTNSEDDYEVFSKGEEVKYKVREDDVLLEAIEDHDHSWWIVSHESFHKEFEKIS